MGRGRGMEFWCCAIPLINVGSYVTVVEIALVAFLVGVLALAGSPFVAGLDVIPSFAKAIVAALGFITCAWQVVGLVSIKREATKLYHIYVRITTILTLAILAVVIAFFAVAASQHSKAQSACNNQYGALPSTTSQGFTNSDITQNFGDQICNYFIWAQVGTMGGLIVLIGLVQLYMCFALRSYGVAQREAYRDFKTGGNHQRDDEIPLSSRNMPNNDSEVWQNPREYSGGVGRQSTIPAQHDYHDNEYKDSAANSNRFSATSQHDYNYGGQYTSHYETEPYPQHNNPYGGREEVSYPAYAGGQSGHHTAQPYSAYPSY
ncbi:unnamed protein product [Sympodiomycopsis kandeliae]